VILEDEQDDGCNSATIAEINMARFMEWRFHSISLTEQQRRPNRANRRKGNK